MVVVCSVVSHIFKMDAVALSKIYRQVFFAF